MTVMIPAWIDDTLTPVEKLDVHKRGLKHQAVSVFVMNGDRLLLQQRALSKYHTPGLWANTCCTHPHWQEDPKTCAVRRLNEELGITGLTLIRRDQIEYRADVGDGLIEHEVVDLFVAEAPLSLNLALNPDEVAQTRWVPLAQLVDDIQRNASRYTPWLRIYLQQHHHRIFGDRAQA